MGSSKSTLVKMPHCWKSHVTAHMVFAHKSMCAYPVKYGILLI